jgi:hypothetical protein
MNRCPRGLNSCWHEDPASVHSLATNLETSRSRDIQAVTQFSLTQPTRFKVGGLFIRWPCTWGTVGCEGHRWLSPWHPLPWHPLAESPWQSSQDILVLDCVLPRWGCGSLLCPVLWLLVARHKCCLGSPISLIEVFSNPSVRICVPNITLFANRDLEDGSNCGHYRHGVSYRFCVAVARRVAMNGTAMVSNAKDSTSRRKAAQPSST